MTYVEEVPIYELLIRAAALLKESETEYSSEPPTPANGIVRILQNVTRAGVLAQQAHAYAALAHARMISDSQT